MRSPAVNGDTEDLNQGDPASSWDPLTPTASPLDAISRAGAREMLQRALEREVQDFLDRHLSRVDAKGRRLVVRNGQLPSWQLLTGVGPLQLRQPWVRNKSAAASKRLTFSS
jgi:hypothetical protein